MKRIIRYLLILIVGGAFLSACETLESNYESMTKDFDKNNKTYYIQLTPSSTSYETAIDENGQPEDIVKTITAVLLGAPQAADVTLTLSKNNSSTIADNMWTLSSNSITIPAGSTSGTTTLTAKAAEMVEDESVTLVLDMDAGGAEAPTASQINYRLKRIKFCPLTDLNDLAGTWKGSDSDGYATQVVTSVEGDVFYAKGFGAEWMVAWWGETITEMYNVVVTMNPNGTLEIEDQPYMLTDWNGLPYNYNLSGTGKWDNCKKTMIVDFDLHYDDGSGAYVATETIELN